MFWHQNIQTVWRIRVYVWHECTRVKTRSTANDMTATQATVTLDLQSWRLRKLWTNSFHQPDFLTTYWDVKYTHVAQYGPTAKTCPLTSDQKIKMTKDDERWEPGEMTASAWKDRRYVYMLTWGRHQKRRLFDDSKRAVKPQIVARYKGHMAYADKSRRMANSYSMYRRNFKWNTKLFFHLLDLTVLNSWILSFSWRAKRTHREFRLLLVRNLIE